VSKTISIVIRNGDAGKTTTAVNLASALQVKGKNTLLIDPDPQASAEGVPCSLERRNEINLPFYEKYGFIVVNEGVVPGRSLRVWAMLDHAGCMKQFRTSVRKMLWPVHCTPTASLHTYLQVKRAHKRHTSSRSRSEPRTRALHRESSFP
jgi:hypothetical protein